jgi:plasmid maintenance system antidote protein VapI
MTDKKLIPFLGIPPCKTILDSIIANDYTIEKFSELSGLSVRGIVRLVHGFQRIDESIAEKLGKGLSLSKEYWLNVQDNYDRWFEVCDDGKHQAYILPSECLQGEPCDKCGTLGYIYPEDDECEERDD